MHGLIQQMVAYADTDAAGVMYHGRYVELAERSRLQWLLDVGWSAARMEKEAEVSLAVHRIAAQFDRAARLENVLCARSDLVSATDVRCVFLTEIFRGADPIATITADMVAVGQRSISRMPSILLDAFKPHMTSTPRTRKRNSL